MTITDRVAGLLTGVAIKAPCRVATTANITLSGLQTIDGVSIVSRDRVLVKDQTDATENGIYAADSGSWSRPPDFDGTGDFVQGTIVAVNSGTVNNGTVWQLTTASPAIGSAMTFSIMGTGALSGVSTFMQTVLPALTAAAARTTLGAVGLTGNETVAGNKAYTGNNTHAGTETFNGAVTFAAGLSLIERIQTFTGSGTYTPHANMVYCRIEAQGGGGGGGGSASAGANIGGGGGGGGAGGYSRTISTKATIGASKTVTIGAAGTAGTAGNNAGGNGGDTSVGALCIAKGGTGGGGAAAAGGDFASGGAGGIAGTGDVTANGATGQGVGSFTQGIPGGGTGGSSLFGGGGKGGQSATAGAGAAATGKGAGGGGGSSYNAGGTAAGAVGTAGYVVVTEFCWA
jgi:hypothetical protein